LEAPHADFMAEDLPEHFVPRSEELKKSSGSGFGFWTKNLLPVIL